MKAETAFNDLRQAMADRLDAFLRSEFNADALSAECLRTYKRHQVHQGWRLPGDPPLRLLLDPGFPYAPPKMALEGDVKRLIWPHVESAGLLCVYPAHTNIDANNPEAVAKDLIEETRALIKRNQSGDLDAAFQQEFQSYWALAIDPDAPIYRTLVTPRGPTRRIRVWRGQNKSGLIRVFGDTDEALDRWLTNANGPAPKEGWRFYDAVLIWLDRPLTPEQYPDTARDVETLLAASAGGDADILPLLDISQTADVLIGAPVEIGACFGAVYLDKPNTNSIQKGFRPGRVPPAHVKRHATSPARKARKGLVDRVDGAWVHGRDHNDEIDQLAAASVVVIGCGALGASVAVLLAQAGVGHMRFFDGEALDRSNTARHPLGANQIGVNKAHALADHLASRFPHMKEIEATGDDITAGNIDAHAMIGEANLVISATGEWASMSLIADASRYWTAPTHTIWQEPQALAAHSVLTFRDGPCLRCGFNRLGVPHLEATLQKQDAIWRQIPACGGAFTPYGATQLSFTSGFCAMEALKFLAAAPARAQHGVWVASEALLAKFEARFKKTFVDAFDPGPQGGAFIRNWPQSATCEVCAT